MGIDLDSHLTLMPSSVHIAVNSKLHISSLIHIQDPDSMLIIHSTVIRVALIIKAEDNRQLIGGGIIAEQPSLRLKYYYVSVFTFCHFHICPRDSQHDLIIHTELISDRYLGHGTLIIQQIHPVSSVADPEILFHIVIYPVFPLRSRNNVIQKQGSRLGRNLGQPDRGRLYLLHLQVSPGDLAETAVNIYFMKRTVILQSGIGFQVYRQFPGSLPVIELLVKIPAEIQLFLRIQITAPTHPGIVRSLSAVSQAQYNLQSIIRIPFDQVFQGNGAADPPCPDLKLLYLRIFDQP